MSLKKLGGSLRYDDLGPQTPTPVTRWTVGGRSVSDAAASSGAGRGSIVRPPKRGANDPYKAQPFTIKGRHDR